jgi:sulfur carrier protein
VNVLVNGVSKQMHSGATVTQVLVALELSPAARGIAVARNGDVVLRAEWSATQLENGDRLEVLHAVQGG